MARGSEKKIEIDSSAPKALFEGKIDALVTTCYQNERPLQGLSGELDWRFHGEISFFVREGRITGELGECTYLPIRKKERTYHLFVVGGGFSNEPGNRNTLSKENLSAFKLNIEKLNLKRIGVSKSDFGGSVDFPSFEKGVEVCLLQ